MNFKSYSEKSKARRALVQVYDIAKEATDSYLAEVDGKWGFNLTTGDNPTPLMLDTANFVSNELGNTQSSEPAAVPAPTDKLDPRSSPWGQPRTEDVQHEQQAAALQAEEALVQTPASDAFSALAMSQLTAASNSPEPQRASGRATGLKIEKNREERNGVKMPSAGGMCRAVWDALNSMMTHDEASGTATVPTVADIKAHAEKQGWNVNNASIEYYQWRKWHGITGRGKKTI